MPAALNIYMDESYIGRHRYWAMGGIAVEADKERDLNARLTSIRDGCRLGGEVKWTDTTRCNLPLHRSFADVFFDACRTDDMHFAGMYVDAHTFNHRRWSDGKSEIGFNKLIYQLLLHKFGRRYGAEYDLFVFLDSRETSHDPNALCPMLNADVKRRFGVSNEPFKQIRFLDSKSSHLLQVNDLLVGTIGYFKNAGHAAPGRSPHKYELARHVCRRAVEVEPHGLRLRTATRFHVWPFVYTQR